MDLPARLLSIAFGQARLHDPTMAKTRFRWVGIGLTLFWSLVGLLFWLLAGGTAAAETPDAGAWTCHPKADRPAKARKLVADTVRDAAKFDLRSERTLDEMQTLPGIVREGVEILRCDEPTVSEKDLAADRALEAKALAAADAFEKKLAAEQTARSTVVLPLCEAIWGAQNAELMIKQERSNPAGVVDLAELHRQGEALQYYRQQLAALRPAYRAARGRELAKWEDEAACVEEASKAQEQGQ